MFTGILVDIYYIEGTIDLSISKVYCSSLMSILGFLGALDIDIL